MIFVKYLRANRSAPLFMLIWQGIFLAIGVAMVLIINTFFNEDPDYACMGSLFVLIATSMSIFARGNLSGSARFRLALAMGQSRRSYLLCDPLVSLLVGVLGMAVAWCIYQLENRLYMALYPGFENDIPLDDFYHLTYVLPFLAALVLADLVFSALTQRFGPRAFRVVWLCCCFSCMIVPRAVHAYTEGGSSLFARIGGVLVAVAKALPVRAWIGVGAAALIALTVYSVSIFRKAEAKL